MKRAPKIEKMAGEYLECTTETFLNNIFNACFKNVNITLHLTDINEPVFYRCKSDCTSFNK